MSRCAKYSTCMHSRFEILAKMVPSCVPNIFHFCSAISKILTKLIIFQSLTTKIKMRNTDDNDGRGHCFFYGYLEWNIYSKRKDSAWIWGERHSTTFPKNKSILRFQCHFQKLNVRFLHLFLNIDKHFLISLTGILPSKLDVRVKNMHTYTGGSMSRDMDTHTSRYIGVHRPRDFLPLFSVPRIKFSSEPGVVVGDELLQVGRKERDVTFEAIVDCVCNESVRTDIAQRSIENSQICLQVCVT